MKYDCILVYEQIVRSIIRTALASSTAVFLPVKYFSVVNMDELSQMRRRGMS